MHGFSPGRLFHRLLLRRFLFNFTHIGKYQFQRFAGLTKSIFILVVQERCFRQNPGFFLLLGFFGYRQLPKYGRGGVDGHSGIRADSIVFHRGNDHGFLGGDLLRHFYGDLFLRFYRDFFHYFYRDFFHYFYRDFFHDFCRDSLRNFFLRFHRNLFRDSGGNLLLDLSQDFFDGFFRDGRVNGVRQLVGFLDDLLQFQVRRIGQAGRGHSVLIGTDLLTHLGTGQQFIEPAVICGHFGFLLIIHVGSSCQRITICSATVFAMSSPLRAAISLSPNAVAQPAEVPVITVPSCTHAWPGIYSAVPISFSQPG